MSTNLKDYYYILGLSRNATNDEIKTAYRKLSIKFHPDKNSGDKFFEERFKDILEAYETLSNDAKRKIYDNKLEENTSSPQPSDPPITRKKRPGKIIFSILGGVILLGPLIRFAVNKINEAETEKKYNNLSTDTIPGRGRNDSVIRMKIFDDTGGVKPPVLSSRDTDNANINPPGADNGPPLKFKDGDGLTAMDAVNYFFDAFNNSDCHKAWNMSYNNYWVQRGEDWFCSSGAFGGVKKVSIKNIYTVSDDTTVAQIHVDYYAEDIYNGNKCFKQNITVQKLEYTDGTWRWKLTKMQNDQEPFACDENQ
jgi:curved DNA-binding protein CbpA